MFRKDEASTKIFGPGSHQMPWHKLSLSGVHHVKDNVR